MFGGRSVSRSLTACDRRRAAVTGERGERGGAIGDEGSLESVVVFIAGAMVRVVAA